jgi:hypothetical protein
MQRNTEQLLEQLFTVIATSLDEDCLVLWHILTALRGPDVKASVQEKNSTTNVLLYHLAKGQHQELVDKVGCFLNNDTPELAAFRDAGKFSSFHFHLHAKHAFEALGLSWNEVNPAIYGEFNHGDF